jgi:hypothetical protein
MNKNIITVFLFSILALFIFLQSTYAGDRMVLVERFTSSTCGPCAANNPIMDAFLQSQDPERITGLSFHMNWPAPGNDPMFLYNQSDNTTRRTYYAVSYIPQAWMDGDTLFQPPYQQGSLQAYFNLRKDILSPVTIIVTDSTYGDSALVRVIVYCETPLSSPSVTLQIAIVERLIHYQSPPGTNGETDFRDVMRKMLPNANGTPMTLLPGKTYIIEKRFYMDPIWHADQIVPLVFLQAGNKEILNVGLKTINFTMLSNPAYKVVLQGQNQSANYQIRIPVVASGYNSPVTLTAAVDPPNAGISVTFPSGNVINSFPDSAGMQVSSNTSVPAGIYKIIVTGTNGSGKVHKTVVSYLVGKNYVFVGSNRPGRDFKVDNTTYNQTQFFTWDLNAVHNLAAVSPQLAGNVRYVFQSWSNNGDSVQNVTITPNISEYTVNYKIQYKLLTFLQPSQIPATITGGNTFYDSAAAVNFSISPLQVQYNNKTYWFQRWQGTGNGSYTGTNPSPQISMLDVIAETAVWDTIPPIGINNQGTEIPREFSLSQNYPNPFNPATKIKFALPVSGFVSLKIYDVLGNEVYTIDASYRQAGFYEADFDASNLASGVYFYKLEAEGFTATKKMLLVK